MPHSILIEPGLGPIRGMPESGHKQRVGKGDKAREAPKLPGSRVQDNGAAQRFISGYREYMAGASVAEISEIPAPERAERHSINADCDMMNCRQGNKNTFLRQRANRKNKGNSRRIYADDLCISPN